MSKKTVFMFSGQGTQYFSMGRELYERNGTFRYWMDHCSDITQSRFGINLSGIVYRGGQDRFAPFTRSLHSSPAIFAISYSMAQALMAESVYPDEVLGYSLGEIVAMAVSGCTSLEMALDLVVRSMQVVELTTPRAGMMAVLDSPEICRRYSDEFRETTIASFNFARSFVVAGLSPALERLQSFLKKHDVLTQILPISHGFHSAIIDPAETDLRRLFREVSLGEGHLPVASAVYARFLEPSDLVESYYWDIVRQPVRFHSTVEMLEHRGPRLYIDVGPSGTLATFVKYALPEDSDSRALPVLDQFGFNLRNLKAVHAAALPNQPRSSRDVNVQSPGRHPGAPIAAT